MTRALKLLRTGVSGIVATAMDVVAMVVLIELVHLAVGPAAFLSAGCGAVTGFLVAKFWAFCDHSPSIVRQFGSYALVSFATAVLVAVTVHALVQQLGLEYLRAKAFASAFTFFVWSYPAQAKLVFRRCARARTQLVT